MSVSQDNKASTGDGRSLNEGRRFENPEIKRALFNDDYEKQSLVHETGCRVIPSNETGDICRNQRDCEDLSLIKKQLV